jgi:hypothetical protein
MSGPDDGLTARQSAAVAALLGCKTIAAAAKRSKVAESTLRRWLTGDRQFQRAYRAARRAVMDATIGRVQQAAGAAVDALERNLTCGRPGDEIRAALGMLDHASRGLEVGDLLERVEELERLAAGGGGDGAAPQATRPAGGPAPDDGD